MDILTLLDEARAAGLSIRAEGGRLVIRGPRQAEPMALRLIEAKPMVMAALARPAPMAGAIPFLAMSLDEFRARGALLEVRVPWLPVTLWMVPTERDVAVLMREGVTRGRIWTAAELMNLMAIAGRTSDVVQTITHAKLEMDGEITEVRRR